MDFSQANFIKTAEEVNKQTEQREQLRQKYKVEAPNEVYNFFEDIVKNSENPEQEIYRLGTAYKFSENMGIPIGDAYSNLDSYAESVYGKPVEDYKGFFNSLGDSFYIGTFTRDIGRVGNEIRNAELEGNTELAEALYKELEAYQNEINVRREGIPQQGITQAFSQVAENLPYMLDTVALSALNNVVPGFGKLIVSGMNTSMYAGQEYIELRKNGASVEGANRASVVSGFIQNEIERTLGNIAGAIGDVTGVKTLSKGLSQKITQKVLAKPIYKKIISSLSHYGLEALEEGSEEVLQELTSIITEEILANTEGYNVDRENVAKTLFDNFKGGFVSSLILGIPAMGGGAVIDVTQSKKIRELAIEIESEKVFEKAVEKSTVFNGMTEEEKKQSIKAIWENFQSNRDELFNQRVKEQAEVTDTASGYDTEIDAEYRQDGKLYTEDRQNEDGKNVFVIGNPDKEGSNLYGHIDYSIDGDTITIENFKMNESREALRTEMFQEFAEQHPGMKIEWETVGQVATDIKNELIANNPYGKENGLNYYKDQQSVYDAQTRRKVAEEIGKNFKFDNKQKSAAVFVLEAMANSQGKNLTEYVGETFGREIFGKTEEIERLANLQNETFQGKAGATRWFGRDMKAVIYAGEKGDFSTWVHELSHVYQRQLSGDLLTQAEKAFNVKNGDWHNSTYTFTNSKGKKVTYTSDEAFAYGFQDWLQTGKAPNQELKNIFEKFAEFLARCYNSLKDHLNMSKDIVDVYNQMLKGDDSMLSLAERAVLENDRKRLADERIKQQQLEAEQQQKAQEEKAEQQARDEELAETTDFDDKNSSEDDIDEKPITLEEIEELEKTYEPHEETVKTLDDSSKSKTEKDKAVLKTASEDMEEMDLLFQMVGEESIRQMATSIYKQEKLSNLEKAKHFFNGMYKNLDPKIRALRIKLQTGWENDNGKWKYETDDSLSKFNWEGRFEEVFKLAPRNLVETLNSRNITIGDMIVHDELFNIFPWLKDVNVKFTNRLDTLVTSMTDEGILINLAHVKDVDFRKTLGHQMQHLIQGVEHSNSGFTGKNFKKLYATLNKAITSTVTEEELSEIERLGNDYFNNEAEIEARNVAERYNMISRDRASNPINFQLIGEQGAEQLDIAEETTVRMDNLNIAMHMEANGNTPKEIRLATSWERGADGQWKYEIDDDIEVITNANTSNQYFQKKQKIRELKQKLEKEINKTDDQRKLDEKKIKSFIENGIEVDFKIGKEYEKELQSQIEELEKELVNFSDTTENLLYTLFNTGIKEYSLPKIIKAEELYKAYPELKEYTIDFGSVFIETNEENGHFNRTTKTIYIAPTNDYEKFKSVLIHEIQHAIQDIEGFAKGGNIENFSPIKASKLEQALASYAGFTKEEISKITEETEKQFYRDEAQFTEEEINDLFPDINGLGNIAQIIERDVKSGRIDALYEEMQEASKKVQKEGLVDLSSYKIKSLLTKANALFDNQSKEWQSLVRQYNEASIKKDYEKTSQLSDEIEKIDPNDVLFDYEMLMNEARELKEGTKDFYRTPRDAYKSLAGEVEARNVQERYRRFKANQQARQETLLAETEDVSRDEQIILFQEIQNEEEIARLESEEKITAYRAMELIDGKLYPPMAGKVDGKLVNPLRIGSWIKADERPDLAQGKVNKRTGETEYFFNLKKAGKDSKGKSIGDVLARYNPYWHSSLSPLNDQFSTAYKRPTLVTVEVQIPKYELEGKYKAEKAKDSVGQIDWHSGPISSKLAKYGKPRQVILSQYNKVLRVVPDAEVAQKIKEQLEGTDIAIRDDLVTPSLARELEKIGVPIEYTETVQSFNQSILFQEEQDVRNQYENTDKWLKAPNGKDTNLTEKQWLQVRTPSFKKWFGDWENDPENASKVVDENGEPLVVYHGTNAEFDIFKPSENGALGEGIYFASDKNYAKGITFGKGNIIESFINIKKPLYVNFPGKPNTQGHDGIIHEGNGFYVAFSPNQIKSATDNSGEFNADNPSILFQNIPVKKGLKKTEEITSYIKKKLSTYGFDIVNDYSSLSQSQYLTITNYKEMTGLESLYNGDELKIRISNHDLPPSYDGINGYHDIDVISENNNRIGNDGKVTTYENVIENLVNNITEENKQKLRKKKALTTSNNNQAKKQLPEWLLSEKTIRERLEKEEDINTRFLLSQFASFNQKERATKILEYLEYIKNNPNSSYYNSLNKLGLLQPANILFQTAYHGTPHNFDKFSTSAIGTGEGAQSFGWGLYFTNQEDIARYYADTVTGKSYQENPIFNNTMEYIREEIGSGKNFEDIKEERLDYFYKKIEFLCENLNIGLTFDIKEVKDKTDWGNDYSANSLISYIEAFNEIRKMEESDLHKRNLYTVELPDNGYLLWDKEYDTKDLTPLKQPLFNRLLDEYFGGDKESTQYEVDSIFYDGITGEEFYHSLQHELGSDKAASLFLKENGYIGIDYPANSFAGHTDEGKRNYVIFDENDVEIVNHINFQTEGELLEEARSFDSWQEWKEYVETFADSFDYDQVPKFADDTWYRTTWELANREPQQEGNTDENFIEYMSNRENLKDFLAEIANIDATELWQPSDEEEAREIEDLQNKKDLIDTKLAQWKGFARGILYGNELKESTYKNLETQIKNKPRDYRELFTQIMDNKTYAVSEDEKTSTQLQKKYKLSDVEVNEIENSSPEKRRQIARELSNKDIAERLANGTLEMGQELYDYIDSLNKEIGKLQEQYDQLETEVQEDFQRISNWEDRELLKLHEQLLEAKENYELKSDDVARKIERGIRVTKKYKDASVKAKANYDAIFKKFSDLSKSYEISNIAKEAMTRKEKISDIKKKLKAKQEEKRLSQEIKKLRVQLVKRTMRRIKFDTVNYDQGRQIIAIQRLFEPNLMGGINKWLGTEGESLRAVYSKWNTDTEYREKMKNKLANKKGGYDAIQLLDDTDSIEKFNQWTKGERALLYKVLPRENWIEELNLEELAEERAKAFKMDIGLREVSQWITNDKGENELVTMEMPVVSEEVETLVKDAIGTTLYNQLVSRPFAEWTTEEMESLAKRVNELYKEGRDELANKNLIRKQEAADIRHAIERAVKDTGIIINDDDDEETKKRKLKKIAKILGDDPTLKGTSARRTSKWQKILEGYGDARLISVARLLDNNRDGINVSELYRKENDSYNARERKIKERTDRINKVMSDNKITLKDLYSTVKIDNWYKGESVTFTVDELLFMAKAAEDEQSKNAVMYGNLFSSERMLQDKQGYINSDNLYGYESICNALYDKVLNEVKKLDTKFLKFADAISEDYAEQYERMNKVSIEEFNQPVNRVENYVPIVRLESSGDTNENRVLDDFMAGHGLTKKGVDKGMTKSRIEIGAFHQKPIELGLYKTWIDSVNRTEHFIAYSPYVRELNRVYKSQEADYTRQFIGNRYGQGMLHYIDSYIAEVANPNANVQFSQLDNLIRTLRGKTAPAYLAWKTSSMIKQFISSPMPFLQFCNPLEYLKASFDCIQGKTRDAIKEKSVFMRNRKFDPIQDLIKEQEEKNTNKAESVLNKFNSIGMKGLEAVDWGAVAPGWLACYRKKLNELNAEKQKIFDAEYFKTNDKKKAQARANEILEEVAVQYADECVRLCQPSNRKVDLAPLFKESSEIAKAYLQFQTALNVIWNNIRYDLPYAIKNKQFKNIVGSVTGYVMAGLFMNLVCSGFDEDDEEEDKIKKSIFYATTQFTDAIPVLGSAVTKVTEKVITGETSYSMGTDLTPMITKLMQGVQAIPNAQETGEWEKVCGKFAEAMGLSLGLPVSGVKEIKEVIDEESLLPILGR